MLYQQGTQRIEVIVRKDGGGGSINAKETDSEEAGGREKTWRTSVFGSEDPRRIKRVVKTNITHLIAAARQIALLEIQYHISGLSFVNGDQALQERASRQIEIVKDATGMASNIAMGMLYGSWGGPIGTALGGIIAAMTSSTSLRVKYGEREREYSYKVFKENNAIEYRRARAGINLTTGRLR